MLLVLVGLIGLVWFGYSSYMSEGAAITPVVVHMGAKESDYTRSYLELTTEDFRSRYTQQQYQDLLESFQLHQAPEIRTLPEVIEETDEKTIVEYTYQTEDGSRRTLIFTIIYENFFFKVDDITEKK